MKRLVITVIVAVLVLGVGATGGAYVLTKMRTVEVTAKVDTHDPELIEQGEYIARTGDCEACHTVPGDKSLAGGLAMATPVGAIFSTNITPDKDTGIGDYSYADFKNAVQYGIRKNGVPLYPAMPYPSYAIMPDEDMQALYAYFMQGVEAVNKPNGKTTIPWPLSMRWPMSWWQQLFAPKRTFKPPEDADKKVTRGAYLVEGPGHCGACHTPRGLAYQEKGLSMADSRYFLSGAVIDGWRAKSLRGEARGLQSWSKKEIVEFLKTGRTDKVSAFGAMQEVVEFSTRYFSDDDLEAVAAYLKSLSPAPGKVVHLPAKQDTTTAKLENGDYDSRGAVVYMEQCAVCHRVDGKGMARIFPALDGNTAIYAKNAHSITQFTLSGGYMPKNDTDVMTFAMPGFAHLDDEDLTAVINFIRNAWTNQAPEIALKDVAHTRKFLAGKQANILMGDEP